MKKCFGSNQYISLAVLKINNTNAKPSDDTVQQTNLGYITKDKKAPPFCDYDNDHYAVLRRGKRIMIRTLSEITLLYLHSIW